MSERTAINNASCTGTVRAGDVMSSAFRFQECPSMKDDTSRLRLLIECGMTHRLVNWSPIIDDKELDAAAAAETPQWIVLKYRPLE